MSQMIKVAVKKFPAFANGKRLDVEAFSVVSVSDNLFDHVVFKYTLLTASGEWAGEASFALKGREIYQTWDASAAGAYRIVAKAIGLEIATDDSQPGGVAFIEVE